jgi:tRNA/tmRNA/rRNA uracil-C5-methylase (TrmA/RlmC/RlmD family)
MAQQRQPKFQVRGERFEVQVESLDQEGRGVAHRDGKAVFIEGALPGETAVYEVLRQKARYESGRAIEISHESALRVVPRCPHAGLHVGACGGCSMQHIDARAQVALKQRVLEDTLWHVGRVRPQMMLRPVVGPAWNYRHRARFTVRYVAKKGAVLVGFHERASSYVADIHQCEVVPRKVSDLLLPLRDLISSLTLRERLPQIELAIGGATIVLVFRVLDSGARMPSASGCSRPDQRRRRRLISSRRSRSSCRCQSLALRYLFRRPTSHRSIIESTKSWFRACCDCWHQARPKRSLTFSAASATSRCHWRPARAR